MKIENDIQIVDARQAFHRWNSLRYEKLSNVVKSDTYKYIQLIPLFLQINNKILPGNTNDDVPAGVYMYKPDKEAINSAKSINSKFRYHQEGVIKNYAIDAIYFKQALIDNSNICVVIYNASLNNNQVTSLKNKIHRISVWLLSRGLDIKFIALTVDEFRNNKNKQLSQYNISIFLDVFYSESILLAGKYPVWWLVPPREEIEYAAFVEHITQAKFVDDGEFLDLGGIAGYNQQDLIKCAVDKVQEFKKNPEKCLIELLVVDEINASWPAFDGVSIRLKEKLYNVN